MDVVNKLVRAGASLFIMIICYYRISIVLRSFSNSLTTQFLRLLQCLPSLSSFISLFLVFKLTPNIVYTNGKPSLESSKKLRVCHMSMTPYSLRSIEIPTYYFFIPILFQLDNEVSVSGVIA
jgi:flagellar biosynthesis protein FliP